MQARDVMTTEVVTLVPELPVRAAARLMVERNLCACPVTAWDGSLIGIVTEGDFIHRPELGQAAHRPHWLDLFLSDRQFAAEIGQSHGETAGEIMTRDVLTVTPDTPVPRIATLFERHRIRQVPVVENGRVVGMVSRRDLMRAVARAWHGAQP